jgi:hypothetical protein
VNENSVRNIAIGIAAFAVGVIGFAAFRGRGAKLRVLGQRAIGPKEGPLASGPGVLFDLKLDGDSAPLESCEVRLMDGSRTFKVTPLYVPGKSFYVAPLGFSQPALSPRLEVWLGVKRLASTAVAPLPVPRRVLEPVPPHPRYRVLASYQARGELLSPAGNVPMLEDSAAQTDQISFSFEDRKPIKGDQLNAEILRTTYGTSPPNLGGMSYASGSQSIRNLDYPEDVHEMQLRIVRTKNKLETAEAVVHNVHLVQKNGETCAVFDHPVEIPNNMGAKIIVSSGVPPIHRPSPTDPRSPFLNVAIEQGSGGFVSVSIAGPPPASVGLRTIGLSPVSPAPGKTPTLGPPATIDIKLLLTRQVTINLGTEVVTVPVELVSKKPGPSVQRMGLGASAAPELLPGPTGTPR